MIERRIKVGLLRDAYLKVSSEKKLRKKEGKMLDKLNKVGWFENKTNKHNILL